MTFHLVNVPGLVLVDFKVIPRNFNGFNCYQIGQLVKNLLLMDHFSARHTIILKEVMKLYLSLFQDNMY